jgi:hypothetical protein
MVLGFTYRLDADRRSRLLALPWPELQYPVQGRERGDHRLDRYDYLYKKEQLEPWVPRIKEAKLKVAKARAYFNNHARSKFVRNAFLLMDMLLIEHKSKEIRLQDQFTLGEFQFDVLGYFSANSYLTSVTVLPHSSWVSSSVCLKPAD